MAKLTFNRIKEQLAKSGKTNKDLGAHLGVHEQTVSSWCTNDSQPVYSTLFQIADYLGVEAGELLTLKKDLKPIKKEISKPKPAAKTAKKRK